MAIISAIKTYIATYTGLETGAPIWVNYLGTKPVQYAIMPLDGAKIIEHYIAGGSTRVFPFAFQSIESTADEIERLANIGFFEAFADWLESQTIAGTLPTLSAGKDPESIEALGWGALFEEGESNTGIYSVQCQLIYSQD